MSPGAGQMIALLTAAAFLAAGAEAQEKPQPPRRQILPPAGQAVQDTARRAQELPAIELPEYDITGTLIVGVGQSAKSSVDQDYILDPLAGQGPRYQGPYVSDQGAWKLGARFPGGPEAAWGRAYAGYGWYATPFAQAWFGQPGGPFSYLVRGGYKSSQGHVDHADYARGEGSLLFGWELGSDMGALKQSDVRLGVNYLSDSYNFYGSVTPSQHRHATRFSTEVGLTSVSLGDFAVKGSLGIGITSLEDVHSVQETPFGLSASASKDFAGFSLLGGLELWASPYNAPSAGSNPFYSSLAAEARTELPGNVELSGGLAFFFYHGSDLSSRVRLYPRAAVRWHTAPWISLFVRFDPAVHRLTLGEAIDANPYASSDFTLRHAERFVDLSLGADMTLARALTLRLSGTYTRGTNELQFEEPPFASTVRVGVWDAFYEGTSTVLSLAGDVTWLIDPHNLVAGSVGVRSSKNSITEKRVTYLPAAFFDAVYEHRFAFPLTLGVRMSVVGARYAGSLSGDTLPGFTLLGATAAYEFLPRWQVLLRAENLLDVKYQWWDGYAGVPARGYLGVSFSW